MLKKVKKDKETKFHNIVFFSVLFDIVKKNIKLILRSKSSSLVVLLGPLLIIVLVGAAYNTSNIYDIRIGTYSGSYSELAESILDELGGKQFSIIRFDTREECIASIKAAEIHVCTIIPDNLEIGSKESIDFNVDQSRVNLVWIIIDAMSSKISSKSTQLSLQLTSSLVNTLVDTQVKINEEEGSIDGIISNTDTLLTTVNSASESLSFVGTNLEDSIKLRIIGNALDEVIEGNNLTSDQFDPVRDAIKRVRNKTEQFEDKLDESTGKANTALISTKTELGSRKSSLQSIKVTLGEVKANIAAVTGVSAEDVVTPVKTKITPVVAEKTHLSFLFPTLVILVVMLIGLLLSSGLVIREKTNAAFFRNFITPVKDGVFIFGHFLTNFFILSVQLLIVFAVAAFFFKGALFSVLLSTSLALVLIISVFILIGMIIGYLFKSEETAMLATVSVAALFLLFSSTVLPLEALPGYLKRIADFNPFVLGESILKKIMLFKVDLSVVQNSLLILVVYIIVLALVVYGVEKLSKLHVE